MQESRTISARNDFQHNLDVEDTQEVEWKPKVYASFLGTAYQRFQVPVNQPKFSSEAVAHGTV